MVTKDEKLSAFSDMLDVMDTLRAQCPWDKKQTIESLRILTIEEMYELADAIIEKDFEGMREEIGDIMLHLLFYAKICDEQGHFDIGDSIQAEIKKLKHRHPHIYGDVVVHSEKEVKENWEKLKLKEGKQSVLEGVPISLPAMVKAFRIQDKAKQVGFEWETEEQVWDKVEEELGEFREAEAKDSPERQQRMEDELGDVLFALVNYARFKKIDPETALEKCNKRFIRRFQYIEQQAAVNRLSLNDMTLEDMDQLWNEAKEKEQGV